MRKRKIRGAKEKKVGGVGVDVSLLRWQHILFHVQPMEGKRKKPKANEEERNEGTCFDNYTNASFLFTFKPVKFKRSTR